jgi:alpha 1,6-mannosyltransferase
MISAILRVLRNTATAIDFAQSHYTNYTSALEEASTSAEHRERLERLGEINVLTEPIDGGPLGVINWTGPSVFTDSVLSYLLARYGMVWQDLKDLRRPLRVGDVLILPVTAFSPGVGNFGAGSVVGKSILARCGARLIGR